MRLFHFSLSLFLSIILFACKSQKSEYSTDVLVIGGGTGGSAAGIQVARMGVSVIVAESTEWLGGMFSAAGVAAFDGNHNMPSGLFGEFRSHLYKVYGGPDSVATGWVSNTQFEPRIGDSIMKKMAQNEKLLTVLFQHRFEDVLLKNKQVVGAIFTNLKSGSKVTIHAQRVIDATELGDVLVKAGAVYDVGMEASSVTGEQVGVTETNDIIQDMTYAAILKDYGPHVDCTMVKPTGYDPMEFDGCCNEFCSDPTKLTSNVDAKKMLEYGKLPNGKYMINWPGKGNDIYINMIPMNQAQREEAIAQAKAKTIRFVYFIQSQLGFKNLALADDEFPTTDRMPLMPYHRESRRVHGLVRFQLQHIATPFDATYPLYRTGIAVGDYPIDHHHRENPNAPQHLNFYPVPSFNLPLGSLIPKNVQGLIVAEKSTSISNVVNGTTRLQPCVMLTGQAAGALAAISVKQKKMVDQIPVRLVQESLLQSGAYIMPYYDIKADHPHFKSIQKIGATGIIRGKGEPYLWANRTWFKEDSTILFNDFKKHLSDYASIDDIASKSSTLSIADAIIASFRITEKHTSIKSRLSFTTQSELETLVGQQWGNWGFTNFNKERSISRVELAVLMDKMIDPFSFIQINHLGQIF